MALMPHWWDAHAEHATNVEEFFSSIAADPKAQHAYEVAKDRAKLAADEQQDTHNIGVSPPQIVRQVMLEASNDPKGSLVKHVGVTA